MKRAVILFAEGYETVEALLVVDLLRRGGVEVTMASITEDEFVRSSHGVNVEMDAVLGEVDVLDYDAIILPGGMPGTINLGESDAVRKAILAMNDTLAFAAMEVIRNHNLRIPQDIALIGYTDEQHANYVVPRLSAVSHQTYKMGEAACQMLIDKIKGDKKIRQIIIPTCLQVRESSIKRKD